MEEDEKDKNKNNKQNNNGEENSDEYLEIDNLNINQEIDIKKNPKKHIANAKKNHILKNSLDDGYFEPSESMSLKKQNKNNSSKKRISYDDIYLGNEMFITRSKSFPKEYEKDNKYLNDFLKMYNKSYQSTTNNNNNNINISKSNSYNSKSSSSNNIININLDEEDNEDEDDDEGILRYNSYEYFGREESRHLKDFLASINNHRKNSQENIFNEDSAFVDEDEIKNANIFFIENETQLNNLNYYSKKNKCNIAYISLNLFLKKLCTENLKNDFPILYKSFVNLYQEFYSIPSLIEKMIEAFNYYNKKINIEIPDLISLLNKIISNQFKKTEDN